MSKPTIEELLGKLEQIVNDSHGVDGFHLNGDIATWDELEVPSMLQAIREALEERPTYELDDGTVCCRHCGTALGYEEDFEGSTNVPMERKLMEKPEAVRVDDDIPPGYFQLKLPIWVLVKMDFFKRLKKMGYEVDMKKTNQYIANSMVDNSEVRRRTSDKEGE